MTMHVRLAGWIILAVLLMNCGCAMLRSGPRKVESVDEWLSLSPVRPLSSGGTYHVYPFGDFDVSTDGKGRWICIASMSPITAGDANAEKDLYILRSDDNGVTWTSEALLHPDFEMDDRSDQRPKLATDEAENWIVVWSSFGRGEEEGSGHTGPGVTYFSRSSDNGDSWSRPRRLNLAYDEVGTDSESPPVLAVDGNGKWICGTSVEDFDRDEYHRQVYRNSQVKVFRSTDAGESWSEATIIREPPKERQAALENLNLIANRRGQVLFSFTEGIHNAEEDKLAYRVFVYSTEDGGLSWSEPEVTDGGTSILPLAGAGIRNSLVGIRKVMRYEGQGELLIDGLASTRSTDSGRTWSPAFDVTGPPVESIVDTQPSFATDGRGGWLLVWTTFGRSGRDPDIYGSVSLDDGRRWSQSAVLNPGAESDKEWEYEFAPTVATDGRGRWVVVWQSGGNSGYRLYYLVCDAMS